MSYIVYKTTNLLSGRFYVGVHNGTNEKYLGSGNAIKSAIKKYGRKNFIRETLIECETSEEAYSIESILVKTVLEDPRSYNLICGGNGRETELSGLKKLTFEQRSKISKATQAARNVEERLLMSSNGGKKCVELGKAGFQTCTPEQRILNTQKMLKTKEDRGIKSNFCNSELQAKLGARGGKAQAGGKKYNDGVTENNFYSSNKNDKSLSEIEFLEFLKNNPHYIRGRLTSGSKAYNDGFKEYKFKLETESFEQFLKSNVQFKAGRLTSGNKLYNDGFTNITFTPSDHNIEFDEFIKNNPQFKPGRKPKI